MHVPIEKLLDDRGWSAYDLAREVKKRGLSEMAAYRLVRARGQVTRIDSRLLAALIDIFDAWEDYGIVLVLGDLPDAKPRPTKSKRKGKARKRKG